MIGIKSRRPAGKRAPTAEETYRRLREAPRKSRWPYVAAAAILALATYLRSLFLAEAKPDLQDESSAPDDADARTAPAGLQMAAAPEEAMGDTGAGDDGTVAAQRVGSSGDSDPPPQPLRFLVVDSPPIDYGRLPVLNLSNPMVNYSIGAVSNDNGRAPSSSAVPAAGGAAGGEGVGLRLVENGQAGRGNTADASPRPVARARADASEPAGQEDDDSEGPRTGNRAPRVTSRLDLGDIGVCLPLALSATLLLTGATDADADVLTVTDIKVSSGEIIRTDTGWVYRPLAGYYGEVVIAYGVTDGIATVAQTAVVRVVEFLELDGTAGDDVLTGTDCADLIRGGAGNDVIDARAGNNRVYGGAGNDLILAGAGNDLVYGGSGHDVIHGGVGNDRLYGEAGNDRLFGEAGDDLLVGGAGDDELSGGDGNDTLYGDAGDDTLSGGDGDDHIEGGDGNDAIDGGDGEDQLHGGAGNDHIVAGSGNNDITGGDGDDIIYAGDGDNVIDGGAGDNIIVTGSGRNRITAADGNNTVTGGDGEDHVQLGHGRNVVRLGGGNDTAAAGDGDDRLSGEDGDDTLFGHGGDDFLDGGNGDDTLAGGSGDDVLRGGAGDDLLDAGAGADDLDGGAGNDVLLAGDGDDGARGGAGDDILHGADGGDALFGDAGNDILIGGEGRDTLSGGAGDDVLDGGADCDIVSAGCGDDVVVLALDGADDCLDGGDGYDVLDLSGATQGVAVDLDENMARSAETGDDAIRGFEAIIGGSGDDHFTVGLSAMALTGGDGADTFEFQTSSASAGAGLTHQILDLQEGDRIIVQQYEIYSIGNKDREPSDPFRDIYGEKPVDNRPFRFRIEGDDDDRKTYVDVYAEQAEIIAYSIEIHGEHRLYYI